MPSCSHERGPLSLEARSTFVGNLFSPRKRSIKQFHKQFYESIWMVNEGHQNGPRGGAATPNATATRAGGEGNGGGAREPSKTPTTMLMAGRADGAG